MKKFLIIISMLFLSLHSVSFAAEENSGGEKVLAAGAEMVKDKEIVSGSCWDFIHAAYNEAGYPIAKRETIFAESKTGNTFADVDDIQPGDWLYHINHSYYDGEHSGIFVKWIDKDKKIGQTLSYQGENRQLPGRYNNYDLKSVYNIMRPAGDSIMNQSDDEETEEVINTSSESGSFEQGQCSADLQMSQNLKAPENGEGYVRNGRYHWYTKETVSEADILQKHLNRLGFNAGPVDGIIGPLTRGAILRMQAFLGTTQDGYVGPLTRGLLNNSCPTE